MITRNNAVGHANATLQAIRREAWIYSNRKPGRVPPADSPNRPALAWLWRAAYLATTKRRRVRTFAYHGLKFGVVYVGDQLCVMDWGTRHILVRPPTSTAALGVVLGLQAWWL